LILREVSQGLQRIDPSCADVDHGRVLIGWVNKRKKKNANFPFLKKTTVWIFSVRLNPAVLHEIREWVPGRSLIRSHLFEKTISFA
jgi:hypothetical protein